MQALNCTERNGRVIGCDNKAESPTCRGQTNSGATLPKEKPALLRLSGERECWQLCRERIVRNFHNLLNAYIPLLCARRWYDEVFRFVALKALPCRDNVTIELINCNYPSIADSGDLIAWSIIDEIKTEAVTGYSGEALFDGVER